VHTSAGDEGTRDIGNAVVEEGPQGKEFERGEDEVPQEELFSLDCNSSRIN
jgi:hypothetical protein